MSIRKVMILWSEAPERVVVFYRLLGLPLKLEEHGDGRAHQSCEFGGVHFAVYKAPPERTPQPRRDASGARVGFAVPDIAQVTDRLRAAGELRELIPPLRLEWGMRTVLEDPDGRTVELTQDA